MRRISRQLAPTGSLGLQDVASSELLLRQWWSTTLWSQLRKEQGSSRRVFVVNSAPLKLKILSRTLAHERVFLLPIAGCVLLGTLFLC